MKTPPSLLFILLGVLVTLVWCLMVAGEIPVEADQLECLFTGLGFVGLVAAFVHERQQAEDSDADHSELISTMKDQAGASNAAAIAQQAAIKLQALIARIDAYSKQMEQAKSTLADHTLYSRLSAERHSLIAELDKLR